MHVVASKVCHERISVDMKVAIVGAGVIGLSCAYHLTCKLGDRVSITVIADRFSPDTTSDKAGGFILPTNFTSLSHESDNELRVRQWTVDTFKHFNSLYKSETAAEIELSVLSGYKMKYEKLDTLALPWWKDLVFSFRSFATTSAEVQMLNIPRNCHSVWAFSTYLLDCRKYLPWLMREFIKRGGSVEQKRLLTLNELRHYDIVVNCSGLGAAELVGDGAVRPVRGQAVVVRAPWVRHFIDGDHTEGKEEMTYILPRPNDVMLGGIARDGDWSEVVDSGTSEGIVSRCADLLPGLRRAEVIGAWVCRRPVRSVVRLEQEEKRGGAPLVIHNYGHGGQGITLHWGCALEVGRIVENYITRVPNARL